MPLIEAAIRSGVRPTTMILGADNRKKWSQMDVLIMHAYENYKNEQCPEHGGPTWLCRHPDDPNLQVRIVEKPKCYAAMELEAWDEKHKDDEAKRSVFAVPEFWTRDERPLVTYRESYREAQAQAEDEDD